MFVAFSPARVRLDRGSSPCRAQGACLGALVSRAADTGADVAVAVAVVAGAEAATVDVVCLPRCFAMTGRKSAR